MEEVGLELGHVGCWGLASGGRRALQAGGRAWPKVQGTDGCGGAQSVAGRQDLCREIKKESLRHTVESGAWDFFSAFDGELARAKAHALGIHALPSWPVSCREGAGTWCLCALDEQGPIFPSESRKE